MITEDDSVNSKGKISSSQNKQHERVSMYVNVCNLLWKYESKHLDIHQYAHMQNDMSKQSVMIDIIARTSRSQK